MMKSTISFMVTSMKFITILFLILVAVTSYASSRGGGGMDSGGGTGLHLRLKKAQMLAVQVLETVKAEDLTGNDESLVAFCAKNRDGLIAELQTATFVLKPPYEVYVTVNGRRVFKAMTTGLERGAVITVSESVRMEDTSELAANIIHEVGHHFGIEQKEDAFLDALSTLLVETALKLNPLLYTGIKQCLSGAELMQLAAGQWTGMVSFIPSLRPYPVELTLDESGNYSGRSTCEAPRNCPPMFYYGTDEDEPRKKMRFSNSCGDGTGQIMLVFHVGTSRMMELKFVTLSPDANTLEFQVTVPEASHPIEIKLRRK